MRKVLVFCLILGLTLGLFPIRAEALFDEEDMIEQSSLAQCCVRCMSSVLLNLEWCAEICKCQYKYCGPPRGDPT